MKFILSYTLKNIYKHFIYKQFIRIVSTKQHTDENSNDHDNNEVLEK